jgi:translocation and assembly module TamB
MLLASSLPSSSATEQKSSPATLPNIQGAATLNAVIQGTLHNPIITAQLSANQLHVNQSDWSSLQLGVSASPSEVSIHSGSLVSAKRGQLNFSGRAQLRRWSYVSSDPIAASLQIRELPVLGLQQIANLQYPVEGDLVADLQLSGSALNPEGQGKAQIVKARVYNEPVQNLSAQFQATRGSVHSTLSVTLPAGSATASLNYIPKTKAYEAKLDAPSLVLNKLHVVQAKNLPLNGTLTASVQGAGTLDDPKLVASLQLPEFKLRDTTITQVKADLNVADHIARLSLSSGVGPATLRGNGTVRIAPGYYTEASLDTSRFPLDPLLAAYVPSRPAGLHGETELHVSLRGPLADKTKMEAHVTVPTLRANYESLEIANTAPIRLDYANSVVVLQPSGFKGTGTAVQFEGNIPVSGPPRMNVSAHGSIDMRLIQMFSPDLHTQGTMNLDVSAKGTTKDPGLGGQVRLQNVSLSTEAAPVGLENFNATMQLTETGIQITNAAGQVGGGQITAGGSILYRPQLQMNVALSAKSVRLRYPDGMRTVFNSDLSLSGTRQAAVVQGRVLIDSLSFTSDFDIAAFMSQFTGTSAPPSPDSLAQTVKLEIAVQSSSQLTAGTSQLSIEGQANLRIIGTAADPVVVGRAILTSGDIFFNGHQFHLERGIITFVDPNQTKPVLNVLITTTIKQYNLSMSIVGPVDKLHTSYVSDPPLPPADVINLIARGQTTQEGAPTSFGANSILAAGLGQVGSNVSKLTGIAGFQIDPLIGGNNTNPSARIGVQQQVTKNFIFTFSTDVTQAQGEVVQGEYQLNKRWSVSVTRDESGGFAVNGRFHTNF